MRRALVTGSSGFLGRHLVRLLEAAGLDVTAARVDVTDARAVSAWVDVAAPDVVFHLAGAPRDAPPEKLERVYVGGTRNVLAALAPETFLVVAGSGAEYGAVPPEELPIREECALAPLTPYGEAKVEQYRLVGESGRPAAYARVFNPVGPDAPETLVAGSFAAQLAAVEAGRLDAVRTGYLDGVRDFVDARDVARGLALLARGRRQGVFNVCTGRGVLVRDLLGKLVARARPPIAIVEPVAPPAATDAPAHYGDFSKLREATGWIPEIPLEQSLSELLDHWRGLYTP